MPGNVMSVRGVSSVVQPAQPVEEPRVEKMEVEDGEEGEVVEEPIEAPRSQGRDDVKEEQTNSKQDCHWSSAFE